MNVAVAVPPGRTVPRPTGPVTDQPDGASSVTRAPASGRRAGLARVAVMVTGLPAAAALVTLRYGWAGTWKEPTASFAGDVGDGDRVLAGRQRRVGEDRLVRAGEGVSLDVAHRTCRRCETVSVASARCRATNAMLRPVKGSVTAAPGELVVWVSPRSVSVPCADQSPV